ncbi:serine hydrolase [Nocardia carnea]|uniref:Serine hydrolase n=1 Tax=Nocardia carnea TaxID=37328 RepID=A0ABW7TE22_9NOCA
MDRALSRGEVGLQVAACHRGELVVGISAGQASEDGREVDSGTIFWVASAGKVSTATALHVQVEQRNPQRGIHCHC